jgi:hypothetical protein
VCHALLPDPNFYRLLLRIDQELAEQARALCCPQCGGVLHSARYPRKPRGISPAARSDCDSRLSFCCAQCRRRTTPVSVRFLGRRVYVAAVMVTVSVMRAGASSASARRELRALGVPWSTIRRWRHWWRTEFVALPLWQLGRAQFMPPVDDAQLPASVLERFAGTVPGEALMNLLHWLSPLTSRTAFNVREGR